MVANAINSNSRKKTFLIAFSFPYFSTSFPTIQKQSMPIKSFVSQKDHKAKKQSPFIFHKSEKFS